MICICGNCEYCRLERKRRHARDRKAKQRTADHYADVSMPLLDCTERGDWIERRLMAMDMERRRMRQGARC